MKPASLNMLNAQWATDHDRNIVSYGRVHLVDVRQDFPTTQQGRTMAARDPALLQFVSQHHDAAYFQQQPVGDTFDAEMARLQAVWNYHTGLGWGGIGYHTYGFPSGRLYLVGSFETQRANVAMLNHRSIGHCSAGDFTGAPPTPGAQLVAALATLAAWSYAGRLLAPLSHHDAALASSPTECCGATRDQWVPRLPQMIEAVARAIQS